MTKFIIDVYNKYDSSDRAAARHIFRFRQQDWAIKEYQYENGKLMRPLRFDEDDDANEQFFLLNTLDDALAYLSAQRRRNMGLFQ